jgi:glycerate-2-kinase
MISVKNREQLIKNGRTELDKEARKLAICCLESAVNSVDPYRIVQSRVRFRNSVLKVDQHVFDLSKFRNVYVVGGGKASGSMAVALEKVLDDRITRGLVNVPKKGMNKTKMIRLHEASHPIPDESGVAGTRRMLRMVEGADENDLVICLISGGGSSLMPLPRGKISITDKRKLTDALLKSGATINEINTVRKHVSDFKGGWLAKKAYPATILNLILSDVVGDPLDFIASGPTVPDSTTFSDAVRVLQKYHLWSSAPSSIRQVLTSGEKGLIPETPKAGDEAFTKTHNVIVGNNRSASLAACECLRKAGLNTLLLTATLEGEARDAGIILATIAREVSASENPARKPAGIVAGGETTVTVIGKGLGGRNQEIPLAASPKLSGLDGVVIASLTTDGVDGPTDAAGAIADGKTLARAAESGLTPERFLLENDSYHFFEELGDLMFTGPTGTNVNDVSVIIVL